GGLPDGQGGPTSISPIVTLRQNLTEPTPRSLFTYTTTGSPAYLRMQTLDKFDGQTWTASSVTSGHDSKLDKAIARPSDITLKPTSHAETDVVVTGLRSSYLPVPVV